MRGVDTAAGEADRCEDDGHYDECHGKRERHRLVAVDAQPRGRGPGSLRVSCGSGGGVRGLEGFARGAPPSVCVHADRVRGPTTAHRMHAFMKR